MKRFARCVAPYFVAMALVASKLNGQEDAKPLTVEGIFGHGPLTGTPPRGVSWSPDAQHLTYLDGGELVDVDPGQGRSHILVGHAKLATLGGKGRGSEKDRDRRERYGMASYLWAPDSKHILFDSNGSLWLYDLASGTGVQIGLAGEGSEDDPKFSPNGEFVSFVRNHGLAVVRLRDPGSPTGMVATTPNPNVLNGAVDWVYEEELTTRSNYFWSPDSKNLAFLQMIEENVPEYPIVDWIPTHANVDDQRYPQPGDPNPDVRVGVVGAKGGKTSWVHIPIVQSQDYIPRFGWVDRKTLWVETLTRDQKHRNIYFADPGSGTAHSVLEIADEKFLDDDYDVNVVHGWIVLTSWTDGHRHIYLYQYDEQKTESTSAKLVKQLTQGDFDVAAVYRVDPSRKEIFYASNEGGTAGAASVAGELRWRAQAVDDRIRFSRCRVCTGWRKIYRQVLDPYQTSGTATLQYRIRLQDVLGIAHRRRFGAASSGTSRDQSTRWDRALCNLADADQIRWRSNRAVDCESVWWTGCARAGEPLERFFALR